MSVVRCWWLFSSILFLMVAGCSPPSGGDDDDDDDATSSGPNHAPEVSISSPSNNQIVGVGEEITLSGQVSDAETAAADLTVVWSSDLEGSLGTVTPDSNGSVSLNVDFSSTGVRVITLYVADEEGESAETSVSIRVDGPPSADITDMTPAEPNEGDRIVFTGQVSDGEDDVQSLQVVWTDDRGKSYNAGPPDRNGTVTMTTDKLASGSRTITLTVTDSASMTGSDSIKFTIARCSDQDGDGVTTCDNDCDDRDENLYPGNTELCDGLDQDCDGVADNGLPDTDGDGTPDCMDTEVCDGMDNNGNGQVDEGFDGDGDGVSPCGHKTYVADCNDANPSIYPGATEVCDGIDQNCSGAADEGFADTDGDLIPDCRDVEECDGLDNNGNGEIDEGFDADDDGFLACGETDADCDDSDPNVYPDADEICDGKDSDCDGVGDVDYPDIDEDGVPDCVDEEECDEIDNDGDGEIDEGFDADEDGFKTCEGDCNDADDMIYPGADETCDGQDQNCDGKVDTEYPDTDKDKIPDCVDIEECDGLDNDGDGQIDEELRFADYWPDDDDDGWGAGTSVRDCQMPEGYAVSDGDCNDGDPAISPEADEVCDNLDNNCDGRINETWADVIEPNETIGTAYDLGSSHDGVEEPVAVAIHANIHQEGDSDWYKIDMADDTTGLIDTFYISATLTDIPENVAVDLYLWWDDPAVSDNPEQYIVDQSTNAENLDEYVIREGRTGPSDAGPYWIEVRWVAGYDCTHAYTLTIENAG